MKEPIIKPLDTAATADASGKKPASNSKETTRGPKPKKQDHNFTQSRDIREDRGTRQIKNTVRTQSAPRGR
jgi:hypothetical protein